MIIGKISLLIEIITILWCIHLIYDKKFVFRFPVVVVISIDLIIYEFINTHMVPSYVGVVVYVAVFLYSILVFKSSFKELVFNTIFLYVSLGILQMIAIVPIAYILSFIRIDALIALICNSIVLILLLIIEKTISFTKIKKYILSKKGIIVGVACICMVSIIYAIFSIRITSKMSAILFMWIVVFCTIMIMTCYHWIRQQEITKEREIDLKAYDIYYDSFQALIQELRESQHDFKNHIQAIYNQFQIYENQNSLVQEQSKYYEQIIQHDKFSGLLGCGNSIIAGFLYGKFSEIEKQGISITYNIGIVSSKYDIPMYIIIETIGILVDNAIEYVTFIVDKRIELAIYEIESELRIKICNSVVDLSIVEIMECFHANVSTKGVGRGLGLTKIKKYSKKYNWEIKVDIDKKETTYDRLIMEIIIPIKSVE